MTQLQAADETVSAVYLRGQIVYTHTGASVAPEALDDLADLINSDVGPTAQLIWHVGADGEVIFKCLDREDQIRAMLETYFR